MSMSTHIVGFKPPDEKWKKMKAVWDSCKEAELDPPNQVDKFFNFDEPDPNGVEIEEEELVACGAIIEWHAEMKDGFELYIERLPKDVKIVRFYCSW